MFETLTIAGRNESPQHRFGSADAKTCNDVKYPHWPRD